MRGEADLVSSFMLRVIPGYSAVCEGSGVTDHTTSDYTQMSDVYCLTRPDLEK